MQTLTNGGDTEADMRTRHMVAEGLEAVARVQQERDECGKRLNHVQDQLRGVETELGALNLAYQRLLSEIEQYRNERDNAVARRAEVQAVFDAALDLMSKHRTRTVAQETAAKVIEETATKEEPPIVGVS